MSGAKVDEILADFFQTYRDRKGNAQLPGSLRSDFPPLSREEAGRLLRQARLGKAVGDQSLAVALPRAAPRRRRPQAPPAARTFPGVRVEAVQPGRDSTGRLTVKVPVAGAELDAYLARSASYATAGWALRSDGTWSAVEAELHQGGARRQMDVTGCSELWVCVASTVEAANQAVGWLDRWLRDEGHATAPPDGVVWVIHQFKGV